MKDVIVVGGGGFAKEIVWLANDCSRNVVGVLDDNEDMHGKFVQGIEVVGAVSDWPKYDNCEFIVAIGSGRVRSLVVDKMFELGTPTFTSLIHPDVRMSSTVKIDEGAMICAGTILTVDIDIGKHCILNLNVTVGHECRFGDFITVAPMVAISGNVSLADYAELGTGSVLRQGLFVEKGSMLGMGGVLTKNIPQYCIYAGNPAKKLKELPEI